jgi:AcrR family transcriptional regulator
MARASATTNSRLTVDDWVQAGFAILAEEGIKALKIDGLCRRLEVTKGSFYWRRRPARARGGAPGLFGLWVRP